MRHIALITGSHPRHLYLGEELIKTQKIKCWIIEERESFSPNPPAQLSTSLREIYNHHFSERCRIEKLVFKKTEKSSDILKIKVSRNQLNSYKTLKFLKENSIKLVISYGCHKIDNKFIDSLGIVFWNLHGGISPDYRGVITHFWPSYFLEPQMTGMTLHETTDLIDGGNIILQTSSPLVRGDTLHRLAARNVQHFIKIFKIKLSNLNLDKLPSGIPQLGSGKVFKSNDWRPEHLRLIYDVYSDAIVDAVIDGKIKGRVPVLKGVI